jgi:hypothetical protein
MQCSATATDTTLATAAAAAVAISQIVISTGLTYHYSSTRVYI